MENKAALRMFAARGPRVVSIAVLAAILTSLACLAGPAAAKRQSFVGADGKIHACYRVKGKPKGMVRVVRGSRHRCRRGERRMAWMAGAAAGAAGAAGAQGGVGPVGSPSGGDESALKAQIGDLTARVAALEGILNGVTNTDLLDAIASTALLGEVCDQTSALTTQVNLLGDEFESLLTTLTGTLLGAIFGGIDVPTPLDEPLTCPTP